MNNIEEFIQFCIENKERLNTRIKNHYRDDGVNITIFLEIAKIIYKQENREELIIELERLKNIMMNISTDDYLIGYDHNFIMEEEQRKEYFDNLSKGLEYLKNYNGFWNKNYFMELYELSEKDINNYKEKMRKKYAPSFAEQIEIQQNKILVEKTKLGEFKKDYEIKKNNLSKIDLEKYEKLEIDGTNMDLMNIHYPVIVKFLKNDKVISINKCSSNLKLFFKGKSELDSDRINIVHVDDDIIDDIVIEYKIKYDPIHNSKNIVNDVKRVYKYRNESQIKRYYKDNYGIAAIKKIVKLYEVPTFTFYSGAKIYNRVELEKAIEKHLKNS